VIILLNELDRASGQTVQLEGKIDMSPTKHYDIVSFDDFLFEGSASKEAQIVVVEGDITGLVKVKCSKCLVPTEYHLNIPFHEQFAEGPVEDESEIHSFQGGKIELLSYLHEAIFLELPQVFVCSDTCKGLCPTCGVNRNDAPCECVNERIDPRLADLALFFEKNQE
jgi:uncharacterized protein